MFNSCLKYTIIVCFILFSDPPITNIKDNTFAPTLNSPVTLQCDTLANPSAVQWKWYYGDFRLTNVPDNQKDYVLDMNDANDAGEYSCVVFNEVGQSSKLQFTVTLDTSVTTTQGYYYYYERPSWS